MASPQDEEPQTPGIRREISTFVHNIDSLHSTLPLLSKITAGVFLACESKRGDFVKKHGEVTGEQDGEKTYKIPAIQSLEYMRLEAQRDKALAGATILPQSFVVALVSQYDAF